MGQNNLRTLSKSKIESGMYNSASEVVREALRLLEERDRFSQARLEALRAEIRKGEDSGDPVPAEAVFENLLSVSLPHHPGEGPRLSGKR